MNLTTEGKIGVKSWEHYCYWERVGYETVYIGNNPLIWFLIKFDKFVGIK